VEEQGYHIQIKYNLNKYEYSCHSSHILLIQSDILKLYDSQFIKDENFSFQIHDLSILISSRKLLTKTKKDSPTVF